MHVVIFGLTISSSWGNGHATLWRSLVRAMLRRGHTVSFYERSVPYYAQARDLEALPDGGRLVLYDSFDQVEAEMARDLSRADLAMATSYCPDGPAASALLVECMAAKRAKGEPGIAAFYDLDTPVTLAELERGATVAYLPPHGLGDFDVVFSYTGGRALDELRSRLGARLAVPLYGSVDPEQHFPVAPRDDLRSTLSYLGTYAGDRQAKLAELFLKPAEQLPAQRFLIGGAQYPENFPWRDNIGFVWHVPPADHPAFFASSRATLNITRSAMASYGYCPSGRLFEAAACGVPLLSDKWEGLDSFFVPGEEIVLVDSAEEVVLALTRPEEELRGIAAAARKRVLAEHTGEHRIAELEAICNNLQERKTELASA